MDQTKSSSVKFSTEYTAVEITTPDLKSKDSNGKKRWMMRSNSISDTYRKKKNLQYADDLEGAVSNGNYELCKELLETSYSNLPSYISHYSFHPLLSAAQKNHAKILELLLDYGADINMMDDKKSTAIHVAARQRSENCCLILLNRGIKYDVQDKFGDYPIHSAASEGLESIVTWFLDKGVNPNDKNRKGCTPLHLAASKGHENVISLLLDNKSKPGLCSSKDLSKKLPLHYAASSGHMQCCKVLLEKSGDQKESHMNQKDNEKFTPLMLAAKKGHGKCCEILNKTDVNACDSGQNTALHHASKSGYNKTVDVLLKMKPNMNLTNKDKNKAIHITVMHDTNRHRDCLKNLFEYSREDPGCNKDGQNLLAIAALHNCTDSLTYLLSHKIFRDQINDTDLKGKTPLHLAIGASNEEAANSIASLESTNFHVMDSNNNLPLHIAASKNLPELLKLLLQGNRGENTVNAKNLVNATPLHFAASVGSVQCCSHLMIRGAILWSKDREGFTPFHFAVMKGQIQILKMILKSGKGNMINEGMERSGDTVLHLAVRNGQMECVKFILSKMKKNTIKLANEKGNTSLDEALQAKEDDIFQVIFSKWPHKNDERRNDSFTEDIYLFEESIHNYMHTAILEDRRIVQNAIIESDWWYAGFSSDYCVHGRCHNLRALVKENHEAAEKVFNNCVDEQPNKTIYNFCIFEDAFYIPADDEDAVKIRTTAFDDSGKLRKDENLKAFVDSSPHLLNVAMDCKRMNLMEHKLTDAFWQSKWDNYLSIILYVIMLFELIIVAVLALFMGSVWNPVQIHSKYCNGDVSNSTCVNLNAMNIHETSFMVNYLFVLRLFLFCTAIVNSIYEIHTCIKIGCLRCGMSTDPQRFNRFLLVTFPYLMKICRLFGIFIMVLPSHFFHLQSSILITTWQWQVGVVTVLVSWYIMVQALNEIPMFSVFMPITRKFIKSYVKVLFFILMILFIYVFIFFLLFNNNPAFENVWRSFVKSTVWILGDLAYDDMFLNTDHPILYPIMSNIIFLIFVTSISGFIINLIITQPSDHLDTFRNDAEFYKLAAKLQLMLKYDSLFDWVYLKYVVSRWEEEIILGFPEKLSKRKRLKNFLKSRSKDEDKDVNEVTNQQILIELTELRAVIEKMKVGTPA